MKKEKGITLIALVITIIVLIILAMVTISYVFDQNLIKTAASAKEPNTIEAIRERLELVKGNMYVDNKGRSSIDAYLECLGKENLDPYIVTNKEKMTDEVAVVEIDNKYSYLIKLENNITIAYEGKVGEVVRKEQVIEIAISGEKEQLDFPVMLVAEVTDEGSPINNVKWILNTDSEEIGTDESLYTESTINNNIEIQINELNTYYLHVLTTDAYGRRKETIQGPITLEENYHVHVGSSESKGGCYQTPVYKTETGWRVCGTYRMVLDASSGDGTSHWKCEVCGAMTYQSGNNNPGNHMVLYTYDTSTVDYYVLSCGKNTSTQEGYKVTY